MVFMRRGLASLTAIGVALAVGARRRTTRVRVASISDDVEIDRDRLGIPRISAASRDDALFGLGYAIASDRLFQMDLVRRTAAGRLSEIAGPTTLASDRLMRLLGVASAAAAAVSAQSPAGQAALNAFADGVNLRIRRGPLPVEFRVLRYRPAPWSASDSISAMLLLAFALSSFHVDDLIAARLRGLVGDEWTDAIFLGHRTSEPVAIREPQLVAGPPRDGGSGRLFLGHGGASNAWAVAASRSATGAPLLANDPHLTYSNPSVWCEAAIDVPGMQVAGVTLPGVPGILIGRTPSFAWGFTASMVSQSFLYREELDEAGLRAREGDGWADLGVRDEVIGVRGGPAEPFRVRTTPRGPLITDVERDWIDGTASICWIGGRPAATIDALLRLNTATSIDDALAVRDALVAPTLMMAAADSAGSIASIPVGTYLRREQPPGLLDPAYYPPVAIPSEDLPVERDPDRGWIAHANTRIFPDDQHLHGFYEPGFRLRRIGEILDSKRVHTPVDMERLQLDQLSTHAAHHAPIMLQLAGDALPAWARRDLEGWDFQTGPESRPTLLFQAFYHEWVGRSLRERLPVDIVERLREALLTASVPMLFCDALLRGEYPEWLSDERRPAVARESAIAALAWIEARLGPDPSGWTWGRLHTVEFVHPLGQVRGPHRRRVNVGPYPVGGDRTTVWPSMVNVARPFEILGGPSMRFITDLGNPASSSMTNTLGQSGNPLGRHFRDQIVDMLAGRLHPIWGQSRRRATLLVSERETSDQKPPAV